MPNSFAAVLDDLRLVEDRLLHYVRSKEPFFKTLLTDAFSSSGKKLRPVVFLLCAKILNLKSDKRIFVAIAIEYIHSASLIHDDIVDNSCIRRNQATLHALYDNKKAVLTGDYIFAVACRLLIRTKCLPLAEMAAKCIQRMSKAEILQLSTLWNIDLAKKNYYKIISGKTAALFELCTASAAIIKKMHPDHISLFAKFGRYLGLAFQIIDDCFDYSPNEDALGKATLRDLSEGKLTLPLLCALNTELNFRQRPLFSMLTKVCQKKEINISEAKQIQDLVLKLHGIQSAKDLANDFLIKAKELLIKLTYILQLPESTELRELENVIDYIYKREF